MKQKFLLPALCLVAATGSTFAQHQKHSFLNVSPEHAKRSNVTLSLVAQQQASRLQHRPTAIKQRVIAQVFSDGDYVDSMVYKYSGTRGSAYNYNNIYDFGYSYQFFPVLAPGYSAFTLPSTDVLADSMIGYDPDGLYQESAAWYNSDNLLDSSKTDNSGSDYSQRMLVGYNDDNLLNFLQDEYYYAGDLSYATRRTLEHNSESQVITDSVFFSSGPDWDFGTNMEYFYSLSGSLDSIYEHNSPATYYAYKFTYDTEDRLRTTTILGHEGGETPMLLLQDSIGYTAGTDYLTYYQSASNDGDFMSVYRIIQYPGTNPGPDSFKAYYLDEDVWILEGTARYSYNSFGNPAGIELDGADESDGTDGTATFYYEEYDDGLSVENIATSTDFSIYPNPFENYLRVNYTGSERQQVQVILTDISGRTMHQVQLNLQPGTSQLELPVLTAGNYFLKITGKNGKSFATTLVKK